MDINLSSLLLKTGSQIKVPGKYMLRHRKIFHELVMVKFHVQIVYLLFLTHDKYKGKTWKAVLQIIDVASRFKASVPLTSKNSSEVAKAFKKIYDNPTARLMEA